DPDLYTRMAAVQALCGRGDSAAAPLVDLLAAGPEDALLVGAAAAALAGFGPAVALAPLCALLDHPDASVREQAVGALARLGDPGAAGPLQAYAAHEPDAYLAGQARDVARRLLLS